MEPLPEKQKTGNKIVLNSLQWLHRSLVQLYDYTGNGIIYTGRFKMPKIWYKTI